MSKENNSFKWNKGPPQLDDHSEAKLIILSDYIQEYLSIVCQQRTIDKYNITLIDGFAGGGVYQDNKQGSPFTMMDAINKASVNINKGRGKPISINPYYFFIEKDKNAFESLRNSMHNVDQTNIEVKQGDFNHHIDEVIAHIKNRNPRGGGGAIFFLDQKGYSDVGMDVLKKIRQELPKAEVIINIGISWLVDFIDDTKNFQSVISNMKLDKFIDLKDINKIKSEEVDSRYIIEAKLSTAIKKAACFPYFRPFFIEPENNHRGYWLLHLAPHYRAHNAMSEVIWRHGNSMRHYGGSGTRIFDLSYKGGHVDIPDLFGDTFNSNAKVQHFKGLSEDLPRIIWQSDSIHVEELIQKTCNQTAATKEMYLESLRQISEQQEIIIIGKSGGAKRGGKIGMSDIVLPNKQIIMPF